MRHGGPTPRPALLVPLMLAAVLLVACSGGAGGDGMGGPEPEQPSGQPPAPEQVPTDAPPTLNRPTPAPDPLTSRPPPGGAVVAADRVDTSGVAAGFPTLVWTRGPRTLGVYGRAGGCTEARAAVVAQDARQVVVRVEQVTTSPGPCTRELIYPPLEVALDDDLGDRRVVLRTVVR